MANNFTLIAHRGASEDAPENTREAFDLALRQGFPHIETDCQLSSDGAVMIIHDEKLDRLTAGAATGLVASKTAQELLRLDVGAWKEPHGPPHRIPLLTEVLQDYKGRVHLHLELKSEQPELAGAVAQLLAGAGWLLLALGGGPWEVPGLTITSFHLPQLLASKQALPQGVRHAWLVQELTGEVVGEAVRWGLQQVCPRANACTREGVAAAELAGLSVRAWGIKSLQDLERVRACGVGGCTVNWPQRALPFLRGFAEPEEPKDAAPSFAPPSMAQ
eukprot:jgi/Botrbrau1/2197/Bobra.101_2s0028.1